MEADGGDEITASEALALAMTSILNGELTKIKINPLEWAFPL